MNNEQYLNEVQKALDKDIRPLGDVYRLYNKGKSRNEIAKELNVTKEFAYYYILFCRAIEKRRLPKSPKGARNCVSVLRDFLKLHRKDFSKLTIQKLTIWKKSCDRRANDPQARLEEVTKSGIAGIYVYTYPHYYRHPDVTETNDTDARIRLKVGMSEKDACKRIMQQRTGMPERPKILQIWKVENDSNMREIEKKIHEHLRKIGHGDHSNEGREWFLTNEQSIASTANLLGLSCLYDHKGLFDNWKPKTDD